MEVSQESWIFSDFELRRQWSCDLYHIVCSSALISTCVAMNITRNVLELVPSTIQAVSNAQFQRMVRAFIRQTRLEMSRELGCRQAYHHIADEQGVFSIRKWPSKGEGGVHGIFSGRYFELARGSTQPGWWKIHKTPKEEEERRNHAICVTMELGFSPAGRNLGNLGWQTS